MAIPTIAPTTTIAGITKVFRFAIPGGHRIRNRPYAVGICTGRRSAAMINAAHLSDALSQRMCRRCEAPAIA
jgi:hypothetical protein